MDVKKGTVEYEIVCEAVGNGVRFTWNKINGYAVPLSRVEVEARSLMRAAILRGICPDELKGRSVAFAEIEEEKAKAEIERKKAEVARLKKELADMKS